MALSEKALLVTLNISQWQGKALDRRASVDVVQRNGAATGTARVNKTLLPSAASLDRVHKLSAAMRTKYYDLTLPWAEGLGIIRTDAYLNFCNVMNGMQYEWLKAVRAFEADYPARYEESKTLLGNLFNASDYPHPDNIRSKFRVDIGFIPVPDNKDWRIDVGAEEEDELRRQLAERVAESEGRAMQAAWERLFKVVEKAHERLSNPENIFRDSLIENAREICAVLPSLNISDDPNLERMRQELERGLCQCDPDVLREDEGERAVVSDHLAGIMSKMGMFYGAA